MGLSQYPLLKLSIAGQSQGYANNSRWYGSDILQGSIKTVVLYLIENHVCAGRLPSIVIINLTNI